MTVLSEPRLRAGATWPVACVSESSRAACSLPAPPVMRGVPHSIHRNAVEPLSADWPHLPTDVRRAGQPDPDRTLANYPVRHLLRHFEGVTCTSSTP